ncbi:hypothetical protein BI364_14265 [Acidihalobacter yilgarnensis]|uniref:Probable transcriptional regulatory protein BI364_14265 n=1 Tax=Acidihalobacter yilgarnensis TaxID=2819280 RepID=A0A1D8IRE6_9GAMM|nr:YebC/PmpR family DNA-binding transcriptional regulator [Acidihalobacter yilgarnensis]AOU98963.1 hypothetical protein BI364_14265 [Acidihalobacter yilgarnensis]
MAGHSKWANIQHRKGAQDKKRGKLFTKLIREITVSARMGGDDLSANPRLRIAIDKALAANMPKDTVERARKRGAGELDGDNYEEVRYEGYGPSGVAVMVDCMTDNRNRTVAEVRHAFTKAGGNLGTDGSVAFMFTHTGVLNFPPGLDEDRLMEVALEAGAEDVITDADGSIEVLTRPDAYEDVAAAMREAGLEPDNAEATMRPNNLTPIDVETAETMIRLIETLEDLDDVQSVYANADFPDEVLERMAAD